MITEADRIAALRKIDNGHDFFCQTIIDALKIGIPERTIINHLDGFEEQIARRVMKHTMERELTVEGDVEGEIETRVIPAVETDDTIVIKPEEVLDR